MDDILDRRGVFGSKRFSTTSLPIRGSDCVAADHPQWREHPDGAFLTDTAQFSMIVYQSGSCGDVRFLVRDRRPDGPPVLIGAGVRASINSAMFAAERMAAIFQSTCQPISPRAIVVDDDGPVRGAVADTLRDDGYQVTEAASGEEALRQLERATQPVILVTDVNLGAGMSGLELAATARARALAEGILLVSGADIPEGQTTPEALLFKPFSTVQLLDRVMRIANHLDLTDQLSIH